MIRRCATLLLGGKYKMGKNGGGVLDDDTQRERKQAITTDGLSLSLSFKNHVPTLHSPPSSSRGIGEDTRERLSPRADDVVKMT
jgi:hypothetical protein